MKINDNFLVIYFPIIVRLVEGGKALSKQLGSTNSYCVMFNEVLGLKPNSP